MKDVARNYRIGFRCSAYTCSKLEFLAKEKHMSLSDYINNLLNAHIACEFTLKRELNISFDDYND